MFRSVYLVSVGERNPTGVAKILKKEFRLDQTEFNKILTELNKEDTEGKPSNQGVLLSHGIEENHAQGIESGVSALG
ncbi:hypothetical protein EC991_001906, partial [Linnemannia zychae]